MNRALMKTFILFSLLFLAVFLMVKDPANIAFAEPKGLNVAQNTVSDANNNVDNGYIAEPTRVRATIDDTPYEVQAILGAQKSVVVSGAMNGVLEKLPFENGDTFKKSDVLVSYDCRLETARVREIQARLRISKRQKEAYERLKEQRAVADVEYISIVEQYQQELAQLNQAKARASLCTIKAPFDGRVTNKVASNHESVPSGRVLLEISSNDPLQAELLIPSIWLRWVNIGTSLEILVHETGQSYAAEIVRIHGEVDPVTRTAHVVARINKYEEELLPGMSGKAVFSTGEKDTSTGFLGLKVGGQI